MTVRARSRRRSRPGVACAALLGAALALAALPTAAPAQTVRGRVVEAVTESALPGATLKLLDQDGRTVASTIAGPAGAFVLRAPRVGDYTVTAEHIGYAALTRGPVAAAQDDVAELLLRMPVEVIPLNPLNVEVEARVRKLERVGFYDRKRLGLGTFIDREQIDEHARTASDVLRRVSGLRLIIQGYFTDVQSRGMSCRPAIYLDGALASGPRRTATSFNLEDLPAPDIEAVEVYPGSASVPPQFTGGNSMCGIILFWTTKPGR